MDASAEELEFVLENFSLFSDEQVAVSLVDIIGPGGVDCWEKKTQKVNKYLEFSKKRENWFVMTCNLENAYDFCIQTGRIR